MPDVQEVCEVLDLYPIHEDFHLSPPLLLRPMCPLWAHTQTTPFLVDFETGKLKVNPFHLFLHSGQVQRADKITELLLWLADDGEAGVGSAVECLPMALMDGDVQLEFDINCAGIWPHNVSPTQIGTTLNTRLTSHAVLAGQLVLSLPKLREDEALRSELLGHIVDGFNRSAPWLSLQQRNLAMGVGLYLLRLARGTQIAGQDKTIYDLVFTDYAHLSERHLFDALAVVAHVCGVKAGISKGMAWFYNDGVLQMGPTQYTVVNEEPCREVQHSDPHTLLTHDTNRYAQVVFTRDVRVARFQAFISGELRHYAVLTQLVGDATVYEELHPYAATGNVPVIAICHHCETEWTHVGGGFVSSDSVHPLLASDICPVCEFAKVQLFFGARADGPEI